MPGVPSGKACNECRKVKKKCDQLRPCCSRCQRLRLRCEGSGQQRYMFKYANPGKLESPAAQEIANRKLDLEVSTRQTPTLSFQIPADLLTTSFIRTLEIRDVRYDISYYGPFLREIPQILGQSPALDAAAKALVTSYPHFRGNNIPPNVLQYYGRSLRVLRETLNDPKKAHAPETLCAIYLITVCESWLGPSEGNPKSGMHGQAVAYLLQKVDLKKCDNDFERDMITTLTVMVIFESIANLNVLFEQTLLERLLAFIQPEAPTNPSPLSIMSRLPVYMRNPDPYIVEIGAAYIKTCEIVQKIRSALDKLPTSESESFSSPLAFQKAQLLAQYATMLTMLLALNALLRLFDPDNPVLQSVTHSFCEQILFEAQAAYCYRPLGAAYFAVCLVVALATSDDPEQIVQIERVLADYQSDFKHYGWKNQCFHFGKILEYHRNRLRAGTQNGALVKIQTESSEACCMM
ncbi:hypothetical protein N7493_004450 [Penicillium malachiteum]|uniref:Zn(2)-C6 fungal-type domain-containing protein n=1 Tax=Penicillium malachiteum TaxID=1324776 RepID=A0AAD6HP50_9EURO|nr:hypothetical protein N7493_004450 [Penicillium malachiteum]